MKDLLQRKLDAASISFKNLCQTTTFYWVPNKLRNSQPSSSQHICVLTPEGMGGGHSDGTILLRSGSGEGRCCTCVWETVPSDHIEKWKSAKPPVKLSKIFKSLIPKITHQFIEPDKEIISTQEGSSHLSFQQRGHPCGPGPCPTPILHFIGLLLPST